MSQFRKLQLFALFSIIVGSTSSFGQSLQTPYDYSNFLPSQINFTGEEDSLRHDLRAVLRKKMDEGQSLVDENSDEELDELPHKAYYYLDTKRLIDAFNSNSYLEWKNTFCYSDTYYCSENEYQKVKNLIGTLTDIEIAELINYSEWNYQILNNFLWTPETLLNELEEDISDVETRQNLIQEMEASLHATTTGLQKLHSIEENSIVYRCDTGTFGTQEVPNYISDFFTPDSINNIQLYRSFKSTTKAKLTSLSRLKYVDNCPYLRVITASENSRGKEIYLFSTRKEEEEVLFLANTYFKVTGYEEFPDKKVRDFNFQDNTTFETDETFTQRIIYLKECRNAVNC